MKKKLVVLFFFALTSVCYAQTESELIERHKKEIAKKHESPNKPVDNRTTQKNIDWNYFFCYGDMFDWDRTVSEWEDNFVMGASYSYSRMSPLSLSFNVRNPWFSILGVEFGCNFDDKVYTVEEKVEETLIVNGEYVGDRITTTYIYQLDPQFNITWKPAISLPYVDLGCGIGAWFAKDQENNGKWELFPLIKPEITGYIPIGHFDYYISWHVGYNLPLGCNEMRGLTFGMGFHFLPWWY